MCPLLWHGAKATGSEALVTGRNRIMHMARNTDPYGKIRGIVRINMPESAHRVINKRNGSGTQTLEGYVH